MGGQRGRGSFSRLQLLLLLLLLLLQLLPLLQGRRHLELVLDPFGGLGEDLGHLLGPRPAPRGRRRGLLVLFVTEPDDTDWLTGLGIFLVTLEMVHVLDNGFKLSVKMLFQLH